MTNLFDVAISYVWEDRLIAHQIVESLRKKGVRVFFDRHEQLWGRSLYEYLIKLYEESRMCIVIVSESYENSQWASTEFRNLVAHSRMRDSFAVFPIIIGPVRSSILDNLAFIDWSKADVDDIAIMVEKKLQLLPQSLKKKREPENYHVIVYESKWSVKRAGTKRASSVHKTLEEAIAAAREIANKHRPSELVIHLEDGTIASREVFKSKESHADSDN